MAATDSETDEARRTAVSVYTDLLRMALSTEDERDDASLPELIDHLISRKAVLHLGARSDGDPQADRGVTSVLGRELDYDVALVRLCDRLEIEQSLTDPSSGPSERRHAEEQVCEHIPALVPLLLGGCIGVESMQHEGARGRAE